MIMIFWSPKNCIDIQVSAKFMNHLANGNFDFKSYFNKEPLLYNENRQPDYLSTCFYMLNCLQKYAPNQTDELGRFEYKYSFQNHFNCIFENLGGKYFDTLHQSLPRLKRIPKKSFKAPYFISHDNDNDTLCGSFWQDGFYALIKGKIDILLKLIFYEVLRRPTCWTWTKLWIIYKRYSWFYETESCEGDYSKKNY